MQKQGAGEAGKKKFSGNQVLILGGGSTNQEIARAEIGSFMAGRKDQKL